jgi:WD40 repeat protein
MVSGSLVGSIVIVRLNDGERVVMQKVHEGRVSHLAFTRDGKKLISGGEDRLLSILEFNDILYHEG